ncbi:MAG: hypothetical protein AAF809_07740 [Bacteroidota bacterium]
MFDLYLLLASDEADASDSVSASSSLPAHSRPDHDDDLGVESIHLDMIGGDGDTGVVSLAA